jgi:hypothetical protein
MVEAFGYMELLVACYKYYDGDVRHIVAATHHTQGTVKTFTFDYLPCRLNQSSAA